ncbi:Modification methylase MboII [endosymbiont DhMRE of Dentiscutata heterogama]|uniref:DNA-methyltransferase n=1 Tax=endosymbiont DhMRE of Dentiscutata heterogama TaxID=1609546 RepID=UPI000629DA59|nr:site-specific DNA-methyltransferase [endosymbiont DhMRE of Dentiscutata heterogama]CFW93384.1 Modification methylase MboII [endosymbiont DhMRE of Dentiscutata heterogama]
MGNGKKLKINQIHQMDILQFLDRLEENSIDLVIADPPHNLIDAEWDQFKDKKEFFNFTYSWIDKLIPKLKKTVSIYIFNTPYNCAYIASYLRNKGLIYQNWITWYKKDGLSSNKRQYCSDQETILFFTGSKNYVFNYNDIRIPYTHPTRVNSPKGILKNGKRWFPHPDGKLCPDVWEISSDRHKKKVNGRIVKNEHPTPKPEDMIERMIKASSNKGDLVLDLFSGTGTTSLMAKKLGRNYIGCEKNEKFCQMASNRIE